MFKFKDGSVVKVGDVFTTQWQYQHQLPEFRTDWVVTQINNNGRTLDCKSIGGPYPGTHYTVTYDPDITSDWIKINKDGRKKTGFGKFIERIEA